MCVGSLYVYRVPSCVGFLCVIPLRMELYACRILCLMSNALQMCRILLCVQDLYICGLPLHLGSINVWDLTICVESLYVFWIPLHVGSQYGIFQCRMPLWDPFVGSVCVWIHLCVDPSVCGSLCVWNHCETSEYGIYVWDLCVRSMSMGYFYVYGISHVWSICEILWDPVWNPSMCVGSMHMEYMSWIPLYVESLWGPCVWDPSMCVGSMCVIHLWVLEPSIYVGSLYGIPL